MQKLILAFVFLAVGSISAFGQCGSLVINPISARLDCIGSAGGGGTVSSVAGSLTGLSWLTLSGSPITTSGTLAFSVTSGQTANEFLATPNGTTGTVGLRAIVAADVPTLNQNTTGTAAGLASYPALCTGSQFSLGLSSGSNNCATPSSSGGTVTSVGFTGGLITVGTPTTTPAFTVAGNSGGFPYFSGPSTWASSAAGAAGTVVLWGGAGNAPTATTGTLALGGNTAFSGAFTFTGTLTGNTSVTFPTSGTLSTTTVVTAPPYMEIGSTFYIPETMYSVTKPPASPTWINSLAPSTAAAATNGNYYVMGSTGTVYWQTQTATTSAEVVCVPIELLQGATGSTNCGAWLRDSTNGFLWALISAPAGANASFQLYRYTYSGTGNPTGGTQEAYYPTVIQGSGVNMRLSVSGTTLTASLSVDGGVTYTALGLTETVGTISAGGFLYSAGSTTPGAAQILSLVTN